MIDKQCSEVGDRNRKRYESGSLEFLDYPEGCECACMHRPVEEWDKMYSTPPPWKEPNE